MCEPTTIALAMAGTQIAGGMMSARATNKASEANAEAMAKQARSQMGQQLIEQLTNLQNTARERFGRAKEEEESLATVKVNFSDIIGTPTTDVQQMLKNDASDAQWALAKSMELAQLTTKEQMHSIALGAASQIAQLPTVSTTQQVLGVAEAGASAGAAYLQMTSLKAMGDAAPGGDDTTETTR